MPDNCRQISRRRSRGATGEDRRKRYEIKRPMASETAAVSEPAFAVLTNTSKGWLLPFSLTVTNAFPNGVLMLIVYPCRLLGLGFLAGATFYWKEKGFGDLSAAESMRISVPAATLIVLGIQIIFSSFLVNILGLKRK